VLGDSQMAFTYQRLNSAFRLLIRKPGTPLITMGIGYSSMLVLYKHELCNLAVILVPKVELLPVPCGPWVIFKLLGENITHAALIFYTISRNYSFSALTLLVGRQEKHLICKSLTSKPSGSPARRPMADQPNLK